MPWVWCEVVFGCGVPPYQCPSRFLGIFVIVYGRKQIISPPVGNRDILNAYFRQSRHLTAVHCQYFITLFIYDYRTTYSQVIRIAA